MTIAGDDLGYASKAELVVGALREMIVSGRLAPGTQLKQRELGERFRVSPTPVREALRRLASEGLVAYDPHRGSSVASLGDASIEETYQIRAALESLAAALAAPKMTEADLDAVEVPYRKLLRRSVRNSEVEELNRAFHFRIYETAASSLLIALMRVLWQALPGGPQRSRSREVSNREHAEILSALHARDAEAAAEATRRHILGAVEL